MQLHFPQDAPGLNCTAMSSSQPRNYLLGSHAGQASAPLFAPSVSVPTYSSLGSRIEIQRIRLTGHGASGLGWQPWLMPLSMTDVYLLLLGSHSSCSTITASSLICLTMGSKVLPPESTMHGEEDKEAIQYYSSKAQGCQPRGVCVNCV
jgi:hypothetical protein